MLMLYHFLYSQLALHSFGKVLSQVDLHNIIGIIITFIKTSSLFV